MDTLLLLGVGYLLYRFLGGIGSIIGMFERSQDLDNAIKSGSRDPKAKVDLFRRERENKRLTATLIVLAILVIIYVYLSQK